MNGGRAWLPVAVWGLFLAGLCGLLFAFPRHTLAVILLGSAALGTAVIAGVVALAGRRDGTRAQPAQPVPDLSLAIVALAAGACCAVVGAEVGLWLVLIGAGLGTLGVGGLVRELRAQRERR